MEPGQPRVALSGELLPLRDCDPDNVIRWISAESLTSTGGHERKKEG